MTYSTIDLRKEYETAWKDLVDGVVITNLPNPIILDSWHRCQTMNVNPKQMVVYKTIPMTELLSNKEKNKMFLDVSKPTLENIYQFVKGSGFVVALSDKNGCLMEVFGDDEIQNLVQNGNWAAGAVWSESSAGTNIIGTALYINQPIAIAGYEHFCHCSHRYQGAGAPIHDIEGNIIGAIALAGALERAHPHTLGMIVAAANAIEIQFAIKNAWQECYLADQQKGIIVDTIYEGLLYADFNGIVTLANKRIQEILAKSKEKLIGDNIASIFSKSFLIYLRKKQYQVIDIQEDIFGEGVKIKCTISCQPVIIEGKIKGLVFVINELNRAKKLVNRLITDEPRFDFDNIIGRNPKFGITINFAKLVAPTEANVLLLGESGTGKDVFAQAIHKASPRNRGPFIAINCGAIPKELIGSELFGYIEGAFTGAKKGGKMGKFELADGGTLFLDEISEMPMEQQTVLLRVLEEKKITRLGGLETIPVDVRIIAATNSQLEEEVKKNIFRQDLFYRLNVFAINMIPLRERGDDIILLTNVFLEKYCDQIGITKIELSEKVWNLLLSYEWPGNIRELQNAIERALIISAGKDVTVDFFTFYNKSEYKHKYQTMNTVKRTLQDREAEMLINILEQNNWNISKTSSQLNISRTTLYRKIGLYGIRIPDA